MTDQPHLFTPPKVFNEREFQSILQEGLTREGWNWNHTYRMRTASGAWRISTTAVGFPDLLAIRPPHILALEVKADKGRMGPEQVEWLARFAALPTGLAWVLRPRDNLATRRQLGCTTRGRRPPSTGGKRRRMIASRPPSPCPGGVQP